MPPAASLSASKSQRQRGWTIPWIIAGFFVLLALLLGWFVYIAASSFSGVVTDEPYQKGLRYNQVLQQSASQAALGWKLVAQIDRPGKQRLVVRASLHDAAGKPISGAAVSSWFIRPTQAGFDQTLSLRETQPGMYEAEIKLPLPGLWDVRFSATKERAHQQHSTRISVP